MRNINLIPPELRRSFSESWIKKHLLRSRALRISLAVLSLIIFVFIYEFCTLQRLNDRIVFARRQIQRLEKELERSQDIKAGINKEKERIDDENKYIQKRLSFLEKSRSEGVKWSEVLSLLGKLTPADLWFTKLSLNKETITFNGRTLNNSKVSDFMVRLDESGEFKSTSFNFTQKNKDKQSDSKVDFEIITRLLK
ncbi:MAG: PilN domain-containing protein [Candidatus Omnitrophota bacterium]